MHTHSPASENMAKECTRICALQWQTKSTIHRAQAECKHKFMQRMHFMVELYVYVQIDTLSC